MEPAEDGNLSLALLLPRLLVSDRGIPQSPNAPNPLFPARARQAKRISPIKPHKTAKSVSCCWKAARFVLQKLQRRLESSWGEDTSALSPALGLCSSQSRSLCSARPNPRPPRAGGSAAAAFPSLAWDITPPEMQRLVAPAAVCKLLLRRGEASPAQAPASLRSITSTGSRLGAGGRGPMGLHCSSRHFCKAETEGKYL